MTRVCEMLEEVRVDVVRQQRQLPSSGDRVADTMVRVQQRAHARAVSRDGRAGDWEDV